MVVLVAEESVCLAHLQAVRRRRRGTGIRRQVLLELALELLDEMVDKVVVEVFSTKVGVTGGGLELQSAPLPGKRETSKVPPPKSKIRKFLLVENFFSIPKRWPP